MTLERETAPDPEKQTARLFFALCPPAAVAARLHAAALDAARTFGGRIMRPETLHLTLAFLGQVPLSRLDELCRIGAAIKARTLDLRLDRLGWWRHNQIVWAGVSEQRVPDELQRLATELASRLAEAGFAVESRAFVPHVTLLRKAGNTRSAGTDAVALLPVLNEVLWPVVDFVLVRSMPSTSGAEYRIVARWPLQGQ